MQKFKPQSCIRIFFPTNPPYPRHLVLNSCFGAFHSVWVHLGLFRYCTKLGAKRAELVQLMQKFLPRSRIRIFRNECTRSTQLGPKFMFWCVLLCLDAFGIVFLLHDARYKTSGTGATNAKVGSTKSHRNFSQGTESIHPVGP